MCTETEIQPLPIKTMKQTDTQNTTASAGTLANPASMRKATLERIEKAVLELFTNHDFNSVPLIEVARTANVSLQTIYKYFGSKEQLVAYVLDATLSRLANRMIDHLEGIEDYRERLRKTLWVMLDYFDIRIKIKKAV